MQPTQHIFLYICYFIKLAVGIPNITCIRSISMTGLGFVDPMGLWQNSSHTTHHINKSPPWLELIKLHYQTSPSPPPQPLRAHKLQTSTTILHNTIPYPCNSSSYPQARRPTEAAHSFSFSIVTPLVNMSVRFLDPQIFSSITSLFSTR